MKKITLDYYDGSEGSEYVVYENGEVSIYIVSNGELESEVDLNLGVLGYNSIEQLVVDLLNNGYKFNL